MNRRKFIKNSLLWIPTVQILVPKSRGDVVVVGQPAGGGPVLVTDDFNRADGGLGANWTIQVGSNMAIVSNAVKTVTTGADQVAFWNANVFANDQYAKIVAKNPTPDRCGVIARASGTGAFNAYWVRADGIFKHVAGVYGGHLGGSTIAMADGDILEIRCVGNLISRYKNGVFVNSVNDGDLTSGAPGIMQWTNAGNIISDDWEGGDL